MEQVEKLFEQTALLIQDADKFMEEAGWILDHTRCLTQTNTPEDALGWFPQ